MLVLVALDDVLENVDDVLVIVRVDVDLISSLHMQQRRQRRQRTAGWELSQIQSWRLADPEAPAPFAAGDT